MEKVGLDRTYKHCFQFERNGTCKFGKQCSYLHRPPWPRADGSPDTNKPQETVNIQWQEWKRLLQASRTSRPSAQAAARFLQVGLGMVQGDAEIAQEVAQLLVSESGLSIVEDILDRHIQAANDVRGSIDIWTSKIRPLLQLITHPQIVDSAVLEQETEAIFKFLLGWEGSRVAKLFGYITTLIRHWPDDTDMSRMATAELSLAVLCKALDYSKTNTANRYFSTLAHFFSEFLEQSLPEDERSRAQLSKHLDYVKRKLEMGSGIPDWPRALQTATSQEHFTRNRDLPGSLSTQGPRHDNDHAEISNIKILPTYDEIMSQRGEYLPTTDSSQWHIQGIRGRLDREFRLIREDAVGQVRDAVRQVFDQIHNDEVVMLRHPQNSGRAYTYDLLSIANIKCDRDCGGLTLSVRCSQPPAVQKMSPAKRRDWWLQTERLKPGTLVCITSATGSLFFCVVSNMTRRHVHDKQHRQHPSIIADAQSEQTTKRLSFSDNFKTFCIKLEMIDGGKQQLDHLFRLHRTVRSSLRHIIVEFPGIVLASFKHTLEALQHMYQEPNIPFRNILTPSEECPKADIQIPLYARKPGFTYDLTCLALDRSKFTISPEYPPPHQELTARTSLDDSQAMALINTLTRELSLIQGPPGTGKSYTGEKIIKGLLANKSKSPFGPILCISLTNHALDQFLEHLRDNVTKKIIRIGSRSKSERLQALNLRTAAKSLNRTKLEKRRLCEAERSLDDCVNRINDLLTELSRAETGLILKNFLLESHPTHYGDFVEIAADGRRALVYSLEEVVSSWLAGGLRSDSRSRSIEALRQTRLQTMNQAERRAIYDNWLHSIREPIQREISKCYREYTGAVKRRARIRTDLDLRCLQQTDIVGVTTTGLARNVDVLRKLRCKVLLCEEAGEVLEGHTLTSLLPHLEHLILIGDHFQLRPRIRSYNLHSTSRRGRKYSLDTSLFERLVQNRGTTGLSIAFSILETQRRMHPSISKLVRSTLYPGLKDSNLVMRYPRVAGMKQRLFWLHHESPETITPSCDSFNTSYSNDFEVEMSIALVSHLTRQDEYCQRNIAIITPYAGQLYKLRRRMESLFELSLNEQDLKKLEGLAIDTETTPKSLLKKPRMLRNVRVATVDSFQGEEADIAVVSPVRSNPDRCGFMSTYNRINVLLSRAKHGMYTIGNAYTYQKVPMWAKVIKMLQKSSSIGNSLELQCSRHTNTRFHVSQPNHFQQFSPEGGCNLPCGMKLSCGQPCRERCHSDVLHRATKCVEKCR